MISNQDSQSGFTMLEILISMVLFGIVSTAMAQAYIGQMRANSRSETRSQALQAATRVLDYTRTLDPASLPSSGSSSPQTVQVNDKSFIVTLYYCRLAALCSATSRNVAAEVYYRNNKVYEVSTVFAQLR